ncbi:MAG: DUF5606 domain-containing protein [Bacteroidales bacterium]|nr:DUF5606 domain-containing protein [Bacteroidales bacterium]MBR3828088.1 DUF5606 domain-containing protein [Bacteroidales bacterium]
MDLSKILVVSGKPDIYELVSQTKSGAIVESLADKRRCPVFKSDRISSLSEISIFTTDEEKPLLEVFQNIFRKEEGKSIAFDIKKTANADLFAYFKEVLPNYDTEHVHASDVKKVLLWYNLLNNAGKVDLEDPNKEANAEQTEEAKAE